MPETFDAYHRWLGIPPNQQPPNHYRLLGIQPFEEDREVIETAADRQMIHLRNYQSGKHSDLSQKLLNEVAAARVCLLNPERKAQYDLAQRQISAAASIPLAAPPVTPPPPPAPIAMPNAMSNLASYSLPIPGPAIPSAATLMGSPIGVPAESPMQSAIGLHTPVVRAKSSSTQVRRHRQNATWQVVAILVGALLSLLGLLYALQGGGKKPGPAPLVEETRDAARNARQASRRDAPDANSRPPRRANGSSTSAARPPATSGVPANVPAWDKLPAEPAPQPATEPPSQGSPGPDTGVALPPAVAPAPSGEMPGEMPGDVPDTTPGETSDTAETTPNDMADTTPDEVTDEVLADRPEPAVQPAGPSRLNVPTDAQQQAARKTLGETYSDDLKGSKPAAEKRPLGQKFLQLGVATADDSNLKFVLLEKACALAGEAGDGLTAFAAADELARTFQLDPLPKKETILADLLRTTRSPADFRAIVEQASLLADQAVQRDAFDVADKLADRAVAASRKSGSAALGKETAAMKKGITAQQRVYAEVASSLAVVQNSLANPSANLAAGGYYCFVKGDWPKGLPMLQRCNDATLQQLAESDLAAQRPLAAADDMKRLADAWSAFAGNQPEPARTMAMQRAGHWYARAVPSLEALEKSSVEKKLDAIFQEPPCALKFNGLTDFIRVPSLSYDGTGPITIEAIVMPAANDREQHVVSNLQRAGLSLGIASTGEWTFALGAARARRVAKSSLPAVIGEWVHLAGVFDGQNVMLYVNGVRQPVQAAVAGKPASSIFPFLIGADPEPRGQHANFFSGLIDAVRVSNSAKYTKNFKRPQRLSDDGDTIFLLQLDEGEGTTVSDWSPNHYHCTLSGPDWVKNRYGMFLPESP